MDVYRPLLKNKTATMFFSQTAFFSCEKVEKDITGLREPFYAGSRLFIDGITPLIMPNEHP